MADPSSRQTPPRSNGRIDFAKAGELTRRALFGANRHARTGDLSPFDHRVLTAVVAFTGTYSRRGDRVYVAQLAAFAYGIDHVEPWQVEKTRKALIRLAKLDLIERRAPIGRPNEGTAGPAYWVALMPERQPETGPTSDEERQPELGPTFSPESGAEASQKVGPKPAGKAARSQPERQPDARPPTEKSPGEVRPGEDFEKTARSRGPTTQEVDRAAELLTSLA
ncbi:MAG: hypothetical protein Q8M22_17475, partial [Actinomycetota bacterium]|nr:hypothetical protein [Actinomycetota bacterium]